ncbi:DUF262 domain-containing protein [Lysobacter brunescens]|uniref:DUF262 domain-containing protein n=1 Tax=Lysobacter brunescens TaxID=262323 RepID=A0ABW2YCX7_9GAMM
MQPSKTTVIGLFSGQCQYQIPIFQRGYVWTLEKQVGPLWADIQDRAEAVLERMNLPQAQIDGMKPLQKHFLGSIIMTPAPSSFGRVSSFEVIDGQQRSTTLHLLLLAFRMAAQEIPETHLPGILDALLRNPGPYPTEPNDHYKVWPTQAGREEIVWLNQAKSSDDICAQHPVRDGRKHLDRPLMVQTFLYLHHACLAFMRGVDLSDEVAPGNDRTNGDQLIRWIRDSAVVPELGAGLALDKRRAEALYMALSEHIQIMTLRLEVEDDPQVIFETLNARGEPLLASDLVRNFLFLQAARSGGDVVDTLYDRYWKPFDLVASGSRGVTANQYWREKERQGRLTYPRIDLFFYNYAILRSGEVTLASHVFQAFKSWWLKEERDLEAELKALKASSQHFAELVSPEGTGHVAEFARLIKALDVATVTPLYLALRERLPEDSAELKQALRDLSSYLVRRAVCGLTTKSYNRFFIRVLKAVMSSQTAAHEALRKALSEATSASEIWPDDAAFAHHWRNRAVYTELKPGKVCGVLRAMEYAARGTLQGSQHVPTQAELSVEHIMPQSWQSLSDYTDDGMTQDHLESRQAALHRFGNLTLLTQPLNSSVSNGPFRDTREPGKGLVLGKKTKLGQSALLINTYFQRDAVAAWDEQAISTRADALLRAACLVWPRAGEQAPPRQISEAMAGID